MGFLVPAEERDEADDEGEDPQDGDDLSGSFPRHQLVVPGEKSPGVRLEWRQHTHIYSDVQH